MTLRTVAWITAGLFVTGIVVGVLARRRGIPAHQAGRWAVRSVLGKLRGDDGCDHAGSVT